MLLPLFLFFGLTKAAMCKNITGRPIRDHEQHLLFMNSQIHQSTLLFFDKNAKLQLSLKFVNIKNYFSGKLLTSERRC